NVVYEQALDDLAADDVLAQDLLGVLGRRHVVPDRVRVDDDRGAVFAVLHAAGAVDAHFLVTQARLLHAQLQRLEDFLRAPGHAAAPRMVGGALVETDEDVALEAGFFHARTIRGRRARRCQLVDSARPCG